MELDSCLASVAVLLVLAINGAVCDTAVADNDTLHKTLIQRLNAIQKQLTEVTQSMRMLNADIGNTLFSCSQKQNFICNLFKMDDQLSKETQNSSLLGTRKRSAEDNSHSARHRRFYRDLLRKRAMTNHLLAVLSDADNVLKRETKKTCDLNLGFHCDTEAISDFADVYDFLSSENSPGRKRRASLELP